MHFEPHGFVAVVHDMKENNIRYMCNKIMKINFDLFKKSNYGNTNILIYALGGAKESVHIRHSSNGGNGYTYINLHGTFFDHSPDFDFSKMIKYLSKYEYTPKQLDIAFNDNEKLLTKKTVKHWCWYHENYCTGSLVAKRAPEVVYCNRQLSRIHLASPRSTTNFGTIYYRPKTRCFRVEIKVKAKDKIQFLLGNDFAQDTEQFENRSLELLVSCIDFVTPSSKKSGENKKQPLWKAFLKSDPKKVNWSKLKEEKRSRRDNSDKSAFARSMQRTGSTFANLVDRYKGEYSTDEIVKEISEFSGIELGKART